MAVTAGPVFRPSTAFEVRPDEVRVSRAHGKHSGGLACRDTQSTTLFECFLTGSLIILRFLVCLVRTAHVMFVRLIPPER